VLNGRLLRTNFQDVIVFVRLVKLEVLPDS